MTTQAQHECRNLNWNQLRDLVMPHGITGADAVRYAQTALREHAARPQSVSATCWQEVWNSLVQATPERRGLLVVRSPRCATCSGRGYATQGSAIVKSMARGMGGVCPDCRGSRRGSDIRIPARYAEPLSKAS